MRRRDQWIEWIRAVERESKTIGFLLELLGERLRRDPSSLIERQLGQGDYAEATRNREATYLVRMFAEFENGLREAWARQAGKRTRPKMADLLQAFATRRRISDDRLIDVNRVRTYRNSIVHDLSEPAAPVSLADARRFLCRFFSHLPEDW